MHTLNRYTGTESWPLYIYHRSAKGGRNFQPQTISSNSQVSSACYYDSAGGGGGGRGGHITYLLHSQHVAVIMFIEKPSISDIYSWCFTKTDGYPL